MMKYRRLGSSDLEVSVLSFGAWQLGDARYWGEDQETDEQSAVSAAIDAGINLFDTAEGYGDGESEKALGKALGRKRDRVYIASKVAPTHCAPGALRAACEASLRRLQTDVIDLYQIHWPIRDVPLEEVWRELAQLRQEGKIRHVGLSNYGPEDLADWLAVGEAVSDQLGYNMLFRSVELAAGPACIERNLGVLVYMPLLQGILSGRWPTVDAIPENRRRTRHFSSARAGTRHGEPGCEKLTADTLARVSEVAAELDIPLATLAIAWLLHKPGVTTAIIGGRKPSQIARNLPAADIVLSGEIMDRLDTITNPLKEYFGANCDMWTSSEDSRIH